jgi:N-acetyl-anhydromuramyl-L-alanine amidase AmpD
MNFLDRITLIQQPDNQYMKEETAKDTIYLHHTEGNANAVSVIDYWNSSPERVGTAFIIDGYGKIFQCFSSKYWSWHLGGESQLYPKGRHTLDPRQSSAQELNRKSIGIELCSWGPIKSVTGTNYKPAFMTRSGEYIDAAKVRQLEKPYRGYSCYQFYTPAQLVSLKDLLRYLSDKWKIPTTWKGMGMFDISANALVGEPGIWTHTSVRTDKYDCWPQPELIDVLTTL